MKSVSENSRLNTKEQLHALTIGGVKMWGSKMILRQREQFYLNNKRMGLVRLSFWQERITRDKILRRFFHWKILMLRNGGLGLQHAISDAWEKANREGP